MKGICFFGEYDQTYNLFNVLITGARQNGLSIFECRVRPHPSKSIVSIFVNWYILAGQFLKHRNEFAHVVVLGSLYNIPLAWLLSRFFGKRLSYRIVVSRYMTEVEEKGVVDPNSIKAKLMMISEKLVYNLLDVVLVETKEFADYYSEFFKVKKDKFSVIPIGGLRKNLHKYYTESNDNVFNVVYWGNFLPQHGVEYILEAASKLDGSNNNVKFILIGSGFMYNDMVKKSRDMNLSNVEFTGWVEDKDQLNKLISKSDIVLGFFGTTNRALYSIGNKPFEGLSMKKAVLTENVPPVRRRFVHKKEMFLVPPGDPQAIAEAILELYNDNNLRYRIAEKGYQTFLNKFSEKNIGKMLIKALEN